MSRVRAGGGLHRRVVAWVVVVVASVQLGGCATTGATYGSGVPDTFLERPPFYAGAPARQLVGGAIGFFPVSSQRGASQPAIFDPEESDELTGLLDEMTRYLEDLAVATRLAAASSAHTSARVQLPDVRFGCVTESGRPDDDCADRGDGALSRGSQPMHLAVGRPSPQWIEWASASMTDAGVEQALVLTLEVGSYWIRQRGFRGSKEVELGSDHVVRFPWLTSLEGPVSVLQLTGALVGPDGRALRIGAEGLMAHRTRLAVSAIGGLSLITDEDVRRLRTERREDLPGRPLVWQAGLRQLVRHLTGRDLPASH